MRVRNRLTAALAVTTAAAIVAFPAGAQEADGPSSAQVERRLTTAEDRLAELEAEASLAVEEVNEARVALETIEADLAATLAEADAVTDRTGVLRESTDAVARTLFKTGGANLQFGALLSADGPTEAGIRYATVRRVLEGHRGDVEELRAATVELDALESRLAERRDAAAAQKAELENRRERLQRTLDAQADEIAALETELAEVREREEAARRAAEEAARQEAARQEAARQEAAQREAARREAEQERQASPAPARTPAQDAGGGSSSPPPAPTTRQSAQVAVDTALDQVGKPYRWGGGGPDSFDCSGLTSYAWRAAGVSLPHSSRAQYGATARVTRGQLQPGDLVFFGSPIHHVAMYIGGGDVVEASRSGVPVRVSSQAMSRSDIAGYGRP
ncbi:C40 family peptidase [Nitriliruptor alkaliphilus]|uniref:C40 family peptidase n=1 Tax=Nitriliruptor alkaliphilus TaxID=427918 RepID=UPI0006973360|nr:C40 family peptidase [Nitriliruptor alkaliphilus]